MGLLAINALRCRRGAVFHHAHRNISGNKQHSDKIQPHGQFGDTDDTEAGAERKGELCNAPAQAPHEPVLCRFQKVAAWLTSIAKR